ncbi:indolepyruvate oxidoreductase subunit beta family protein [Stappia taiwanensis]|uniref:Indolepyruvate oxidoreductase subunit beta family protein n=1 Tax=Stappia taiwanensis TaxID=992267 RepID=A0A838XRP3_9HYPH|nr:indolepyruvate oxidoreductase subunit beta family protein [Stappia taiwanensis]MBA4612427.1 indolepyruvate oxidoreductase subunit beta family protein [Stappia taiwanensis]GGF05319.1 indolepyruvate oxidoreductase [Stappia taiwanensis]
MSVETALAPRVADARMGQVIKLAVLAVGGQGGGVLSGWIEKLARAQGYACQTTSVAGVAQRTGATIYYIEMAPVAAGETPVFSLAPASGDVDILIAAEIMEAGRAIMRGFVTPDRTTLIASTHRVLAVSEKMIPGDGIADADEVIAAAETAAQRAVLLDMERLAVDKGSVISASLFGGLAGSGALPFAETAFEDAIRAGGKGVEASLRAFRAAAAAARDGEQPAAPAAPAAPVAALVGPQRLQKDWEALEAQLRNLPGAVAELALPGLRKVVDFQDLAYGREYLDRLERVVVTDDGTHGFALSREAAKYIANAMAYDDVVRVADRKTRAARFERIRREMFVKDDKVMQLTEFLHPRAEEIAGLLPARLGAKVEASPKWMARLDRWFSKGRRIRTDTMRGFLMLYLIGGLRGWRRRTHRHALEQAHLDDWLTLVLRTSEKDYQLGVEVVRTRRLVKGYSDTHTRGLSKFDRVLAMLPALQGREDAADWLRRLREAALLDEEGKALDGAMRTVESFAAA